MWASDKRVVSALKLCFACHFFKHSKNHSDEPSDHVNLLHDVSNEWVFSCKMELIKLKRIVEAQNICIEGDHLLLDDSIELVDASVHDLFLDFIVANGEHYLGKHKCTFKGITIYLLLPLSGELLDLVQNRLNVIEKGFPWIFLVFVKQNHLLESSKNAILLFQLNRVRLKAFEE